VPAQPVWLLRLPAIRQTLAELTAAVLDREAIERVFGVRRRRAIELLHRFGGYQAGKTFLVDRLSLIGQLEALERGGEFGQERRRRSRVVDEIARAQAAARARAVPIPAPAAASAELPGGLTIEPGELRIQFADAEDLLRQLLELAMTVQQDYARFEELCRRTAS